MDAVKYLREKQKYCDNHVCSNCEFCKTIFDKMNYCKLDTDIEIEAENAEKYVEIIERWSNEHKDGE